jgi:hypothetical protein
MEKIRNTNELHARIAELQLQSKNESVALKTELAETMERVHPIQLLTKGLKEIVKSPEVKSELLSLSIGMSAGYIAKKLIIGKSTNTLQNIAGNILGMVVSKNLALNSDKIQSTALSFLNNLRGKNKTSQEAEIKSEK